jgi:hypothetical protein
MDLAPTKNEQGSSKPGRIKTNCGFKSRVGLASISRQASKTLIDLQAEIAMFSSVRVSRPRVHLGAPSMCFHNWGVLVGIASPITSIS